MNQAAEIAGLIPSRAKIAEENEQKFSESEIERLKLVNESDAAAFQCVHDFQDEFKDQKLLPGSENSFSLSFCCHVDIQAKIHRCTPWKWIN